jgi:3-hydroxybutyryl-CoA dehydrogenase
MNSNSSSLLIGICGIGQMGATAAVCFRRAGHRVLLWARNPERLAAIRTRLTELELWLDRHVGPIQAAGGSIELEPNLAELDTRCDVILDAIAEDMAQKTTLLRRFPDARRRGATFLSTTSGLSITTMARESGLGPLLVGAHFWNPPHLMPLVEVIRGAETDPERFERVCALIESMGKRAVRVQRDVPGFIGNRLFHALFREAIALVENGVASAEDVDEVVKLTFALRLPAVGPLENIDLVGLELVEAIQSYLLPDLADNHEPSRLLRAKLAAGDVGMKSKRGFYDWTKRDPRQVLERRDRQIVRQLATSRELGVWPSAMPQ